MAEYNPPTEDLPIFDSSVFNSSDIPLTQSKADKRYLRYPTAQGAETLQAITVNGNASFNKPITMTGAQNDRVISSTNYAIIDANSNAVSGVIAGISNNLLYDNNVNSGQHIFKNNDSSGTEQVVETIDATGVIINKPLTMSGSTANDRKITSSSYSLINTGGSVLGNIFYSSSNTISYDNEFPNGIQKIRNKNSLGNFIESLSLSTTLGLFDVSLATNSPSQYMKSANFQVSDTTTNNVVGSIFGASDNVNYNNNANGGNHNFIADTSAGVSQTPVSINTNGLILNPTASYIQFPDNSRQYTASTTQSYTIAYTPAQGITQFITMPNKCWKVDLNCISGGGLAGLNNSTFFGGSGGGGQNIRTTITLSAGSALTLRFATSGGGVLQQGTGGGFIIQGGGAVKSQSQLDNGTPTTYSNCLVKVLNGLNGGNASSSAGGAGAPAGSQLPDGDATFCSWSGASRTTVGFNGTNGAPALRGGAPASCNWNNGDYGAGQRSSIDLVGPPALLITYYITN